MSEQPSSPSSPPPAAAAAPAATARSDLAPAVESAPAPQPELVPAADPQVSLTYFSYRDTYFGRLLMPVRMVMRVRPTRLLVMMRMGPLLILPHRC